MGRRLKNVDLSTRASRKRLKARTKPYYRLVYTGLHLGYRRMRGRDGSWVARRYLAEQRYQQATLEHADDTPNNSGMSFDEAIRAAQDWARQHLEATAAAGLRNVGDVMQEYLDYLKDEKRSYETVRFSISAHILRHPIARIAFADLTTSHIEKWRRSIARSARPDGQIPRSDEQIRKRKCTSNRMLSVLKAGLNRAWRRSGGGSPDEWKRVAPYQGVEGPRISILTDEEIQRLVNASSGAFRKLVQAAILTGCRYKELATLRVQDYHKEGRRLLIRAEISKNGHARAVHLDDEGAELFDDLSAAAMHGSLLLLKDDGSPWGKSHQNRPMRRTCDAAGIERVGFHALRHAYGARLVTAGIPIKMAAEQLGHRDTRVTERHYLHLLGSEVASVLRSRLPALGIVDHSNVERMPIARRDHQARLKGGLQRATKIDHEEASA